MLLWAETDLLMNTDAAVRNTDVGVLFFTPPLCDFPTFLIPFPIWLPLNVVNWSPVKICLCPSSFFIACSFRLDSSLLLRPIPPFILVESSPPSFSLSPPHLPPSLSFSDSLVDSFYCLLSAGIRSEESSCCGQAMCGRTCCRGEPKAAKSHEQLFKLWCICFPSRTFMHLHIWWLIYRLQPFHRNLDTSWIINTHFTKVWVSILIFIKYWQSSKKQSFSGLPFTVYS